MSDLENRLALYLLGQAPKSAYTRSSDYAQTSRANPGTAEWNHDAIVSIFAEALENFLKVREKLDRALLTTHIPPYPKTLRHWARMPGWCKLILMPRVDLVMGGTAGKDPWASARYVAGAVEPRRYMRVLKIIEAATVRCERLAALSVLGGSKEPG